MRYGKMRYTYLHMVVFQIWDFPKAKGSRLITVWCTWPVKLPEPINPAGKSAQHAWKSEILRKIMLKIGSWWISSKWLGKNNKLSTFGSFPQTLQTNPTLQLSETVIVSIHKNAFTCGQPVPPQMYQVIASQPAVGWFSVPWQKNINRLGLEVWRYNSSRLTIRTERISPLDSTLVPGMRQMVYIIFHTDIYIYIYIYIYHTDMY